MTRAHRPADLIRRTAKALAALYEAEGGRLTLPQIEILSVLKRGSQTRPELVEITGIDRATLYVMLNLLDGQGLVVKGGSVPSYKPGQQPRALVITAAGRRALDKAEAPLWKAEARLLNVLGIQEHGAFLSALERTAFVRP